MAAGESSRDGVPDGLYAGQVWRIPDRLLTFADADPASRTLHRDRPVLVVQDDDIGANADCTTVLVMPLSSSTANRRRWEDELAVEESPLDRASIVKVHLLQPIPRAVLAAGATWIGDIDEAALLRILARLVANLGLT
ncbi:MAG: type II toxin-antitoxin system PemK/MazF family toxin [Chloroflexia bacterium]|nr:type II toxin-antitoxin system PemK/MazF family toxin [Chloroflexia bacterium]